ncbi:MAG: class I SAM-dependent methyltransferase [Roseiarcus sp.]
MVGRVFLSKGSRRNHRASSRHGFAKVVSSGRSVVRKFLVLSRREGSSSNCRPATASSESAGFRASSSVSYFPADFCLRRLLTRRERADLKIVAAENFGEGCALTLREWRRRFLEKWPKVERLGFDAPFSRLWEYYLCYWEAGFRSGMIDVGLYSIQHRRA